MEFKLQLLLGRYYHCCCCFRYCFCCHCWSGSGLYVTVDFVVAIVESLVSANVMLVIVVVIIAVANSDCFSSWFCCYYVNVDEFLVKWYHVLFNITTLVIFVRNCSFPWPKREEILISLLPPNHNLSCKLPCLISIELFIFYMRACMHMCMCTHVPTLSMWKTCLK